MSYFVNKCQNCGATFINGDSYCRTCHAPLEYAPTPTEVMLNGIKKSEWHLFIDKNSSRYVEVFSKNEDKKIFFNMNWAAMFFTIYWMFYRKMYKYAFIFLAVSMIFSVCLTSLVATAVKPAILEAEKIIEPYSGYYTETGNIFPEYYESLMDVSNAIEARNRYNREIDSIMGKLSFWIIVPSIILNLLFGLLADCIYRRYILRNIEYKQGGTSLWLLAGGVVLSNMVSNMIFSPIITYIVAKILQ